MRHKIRKKAGFFACYSIENAGLQLLEYALARILLLVESRNANSMIEWFAETHLQNGGTTLRESIDTDLAT